MNETSIEVEAPSTFSGVLANDKDNVDHLPQQDDESTVNDDESVNGYATMGYSYITSSIKWFLIAIAAFAAFFGLGYGSGYGIGNLFNNGAQSSVSSAMGAFNSSSTIDFTTSSTCSNTSPVCGGITGSNDYGSKSGKSAGVSL